MKAIIAFLCPRWMLWGLGFGGDSSSDTQQTTNEYDKRATGGDNSVNITGDMASVTVHPTDYGAVTSGLDIASTAATNSATLAHDAVGGALQLGKASIDASVQAARDSNSLAEKTAQQSAALASSIASQSASLASDFASNTRGTFSDALDFAKANSKSANTVIGDALSFASDQADTSAKAQSSAFSGALSSIGSAYETAKAGDQRIVAIAALALFGIALASGFARAKG